MCHTPAHVCTPHTYAQTTHSHTRTRIYTSALTHKRTHTHFLSHTNIYNYRQQPANLVSNRADLTHGPSFRAQELCVMLLKVSCVYFSSRHTDNHVPRAHTQTASTPSSKPTLALASTPTRTATPDSHTRMKLARTQAHVHARTHALTTCFYISRQSIC